MRFFLHWLGHVFGLDNASGAFYLAWSGVASDVTEVALVVAVWRHFNCSSRGCWRLGKFRVGDSPYKVCRFHHPRVPDDGPSAETIAAIPPRQLPPDDD